MLWNIGVPPPLLYCLRAWVVNLLVENHSECSWWISFFLDSSVGIVMKQRPGVRGIVVRVPEMATDLYLLQGVQRSQAIYPDYYLVGCSSNFLHTEHTVLAAALRASDRQLSGDIIPRAVNHSLALLRIDKELPETCWTNLKIKKLFCCI